MADKTNANIGFEKQLWDAACVLWGHIPAAEYRKVIIGLIFLRYISAAFDKRYQELVADGDGFEDDRDAYTMGYNLMQAIARVNRVFRDKEGGLVVDYAGIASALKQAMNDYTVRDKKNYGNTDIAKVAYPKFQEKLSICRDLLHEYDYSAFFGGNELTAGRTITGAVNFLMDRNRESDRESYTKEALLLKQALSLCSSIAEQSERDEAAFFEAVRVLLMRILNQGGGKKLSLPEINAKINELLKQSVKSDGVINLFSDKEQDFSLFDPQFLEEISKMKEKNLAVELLKPYLSLMYAFISG